MGQDMPVFCPNTSRCCAIGSEHLTQLGYSGIIIAEVMIMPVCRKCGKQFPNRIVIDGKSHNLCRRKFCLECSPFGMHNTRKIRDSLYLCSKCGETNPLKFPKGRYTECNKCRSKYNIEKGHEKRDFGIKYLGGKCICCGYDKYPSSLDFHHKDPLQKDPNFATKRGWSMDRLKEELDKCILLCKNCHAAFHAGYITEEELSNFQV